ncbi:MAG: dTDP-4-dehydrorhamnose reductase [Nitrospirota bacterium]|nr:dTDP-4-dehydrorhamnose reductase [Nitrospirota bacterium]
MEKVLVTGVGGMLGFQMMNIMTERFNVIGVGHSEMDITNPALVKKVIEKIKPDTVINCAAYTKVDDCETRHGEAFSVNAEGPRILAEACRDNEARLVHVSTDYIFDGRKSDAYIEGDYPNPLNIYGRSKLEGEQNVRRGLEDHLIVRTSWLYGENGANFVNTILRLASERNELRVVNDQLGSPTYTKDLAIAIRALLEYGTTGTYHFANSGICSWYDFACEILRLRGIVKSVIPITTEEFPRPAKRPARSVLATGKLAALTGSAPRPWQEALKQFLEPES